MMRKMMRVTLPLVYGLSSLICFVGISKTNFPDDNSPYIAVFSLFLAGIGFAITSLCQGIITLFRLNKHQEHGVVLAGNVIGVIALMFLIVGFMIATF